MKLTDKTRKWDYGKRLVGKKKNFEVTIGYSNHSLRGEQFWYFILIKYDYMYNSLWDNLKFDNQDQCVDAAENKVEELIAEKSVSTKSHKSKNHEDG